jgi:hypothetical protein
VITDDVASSGSSYDLATTASPLSADELTVVPTSLNKGRGKVVMPESREVSSKQLVSYPRQKTYLKYHWIASQTLLTAQNSTLWSMLFYAFLIPLLIDNPFFQQSDDELT